MSAAGYKRALVEDGAIFHHGCPVFYENDYIMVLDGTRALPNIGTPWPRRPIEQIEGLCVHHKGGWASYDRTNAFVRNHRVGPRRPYARLAYHLGIHHNAPIVDGQVVVYLLNPLTAHTWASGSRGAKSAWWARLPRPLQRDANAWSVAVNLNGFFASRYYSRGLHGKDYVTEPSTTQIRGLWGVIEMMEDLCPNFSRELVFGHKDSGKAACPGDTLMDLVERIREGSIQTASEVERWVDASPVVPPGYSLPEVERAFDPPVEAVQQMLAILGYDLGASGVDGRWGLASTRALIAFEEDYAEHGTITNGRIDAVDLEILRAAAIDGCL